jgi:hypothetical protein
MGVGPTASQGDIKARLYATNYPLISLAARYVFLCFQPFVSSIYLAVPFHIYCCSSLGARFFNQQIECEHSTETKRIFLLMEYIIEDLLSRPEQNWL